MLDMLQGVSGLAVVSAAAAGFLFGGVWYGVFSQPWMAAAKIDPAAFAAKSGGAMLAPYAIAFISQILMAVCLSVVLQRLGPGQTTLAQGLAVGGAAWLGLVAPTLVVNHTFQGADRALTLIDGGHWLGVLLIEGAIVGWFGAA